MQFKLFRNFGGAILLSTLAISLVLASSRDASAARVAVIMSATVAEYQAALNGFRETSGHQVVAVYDLEGAVDRGPKVLAEIDRKVKPDLILAVGVWALQAVVEHASSTPVVYAMVLNPASIVGGASKNITGASMNVAPDQGIRLFKELGPHVKRIGVVYNRAKTGYLVARAEAVAREEGLHLVTKEIASAKDAPAALEALEDGIDALWIVPDETILAQAVVQQMLLISYRKKIPLLGLSERQAKMGALLSLSFGSSEDIGRQAGEIGRAILAGKRPADVPYTTARTVSLTVNLKAAQKLGVDVPKAVLAKATTILQ